MSAPRTFLVATGLIAMLALSLLKSNPSASAFFARIAVSQSQPPPLALLQALTEPEGCDAQWRSTAPSPEMVTESWLCSGAEHVKVMPRSRAARASEALDPAKCRSWCLATHPPSEYRDDDELQRWCCEWRAQDGGQCAWSDGTPQPTSASCTDTAEKDTSAGCTSRSLAFEPCLTTTRYRRFGGGRCLLHADVTIARTTAATREDCARRCTAQAQRAQPGELQCKVFAFGKPNYYFRSPHWDRCILLDRCKVRPRESRIFTFYATPEGIPDIPALT